MIHWFPAQQRGKCTECLRYFAPDDEVGFLEDTLDLVARDCCGGTGIGELVRVLPSGTTGKDACTKCFMIHATSQGGCE